jgi:hypothetical protein
MNRRSFFLAGLGGVAAALAAASSEAEAQPYGYGPYGYGPPGQYRRRRRRCWIETVRVPARDYYGRPYYRLVRREVCR